MSDIIIRAESLSKLYKIGALKQRHDTLRDQLMHSFKSLLQRQWSSLSSTLNFVFERYYLGPQGPFLRS